MTLSKDQKERKKNYSSDKQKERERQVWQCKDRKTLCRAKERECNEHIMECYTGESQVQQRESRNL